VSDTAVVVHLAREGARGNLRRVTTWTDVLHAAGISTEVIALLPDSRRGARPPSVDDVRGVLRGDLVPEALAWRVGPAQQRIRDLQPALVVAVTLRAYHPALTPPSARLVLDFVDRLDVSYAQRGDLAGRRAARPGYRMLAAAHGRAQRRPPSTAHLVAAGWADAEALGAEWFPVTVEPRPAGVSKTPDVDVLFFGTLSYPPNIAAVARLGRLWPAIVARRPGATALVAGADPGPQVVELARRHGWQLQNGFDDVDSLCARAKVGVVPLEHTAGIQIKVLEAAAAGLAQVVTPQALRGMAPGFPVTTAAEDDGIVEEVVRLLEDPPARAAEAEMARAHVAECYSTSAWASWAGALPRA
jgi:glycosyltransferase involved in cell wall biosynthesis